MVSQPVELILLRQWASYVATPVWLIGRSGDLLFYNAAAEPLIGRPFSEQREVSVTDIAEMFRTATSDGEPLPTEGLPIAAALQQRRPMHGRVRFQSLDGQPRDVEVTALPLDGHDGEPLGAVAFFWEADAA